MGNNSPPLNAMIDWMVEVLLNAGVDKQKERDIQREQERARAKVDAWSRKKKGGFYFR
jgi:hypothetical protein